MNQILNDNRKFKAMSVDEADALFAEIARLELEIVKISAAGDREIARIKEKYEKQLEPFKGPLQDKAELLKSYIESSPEQFQKPRARRTPEGNYGLRAVSNLEVENPEAVLDFAKENKRPELYDVSVKIKKDAVLAAINEGQQIPGAQVNSGERAFYKVNQDLVNRASGK